MALVRPSGDRCHAAAPTHVIPMIDNKLVQVMQEPRYAVHANLTAKKLFGLRAGLPGSQSL